LIAKNLCRDVTTVFWLTPCFAVGVSAVGFVLANHFDFPPAQMTVALLSLTLATTWARGRWHDRVVSEVPQA
jgi:ABC-type Mn2+/Zn2+ transport system permease subunit